ncbi:MAG TPA: GLPGLI family protein [Sediminibacterium sp.]|jgi:GLPGLI family protein
MRKYIVPICVFLLCTSARAQTDTAFAYVDYAFWHMDDTTQPHFPAARNYRLYLGRKMSAYVDHGQMVAVMRTMDNPQVQADAAFFADTKKLLMRSGIFKNTENNLLTFVAPAGLNTYLIEEPVPEIKWEITGETKDIQGYACQKATCLFRGRNYEAWFCAALPYNNGPWKLGGLPGLILEAYDVNKDVKFSFVAFGKGSDIPSFSIPQGMEKTTAKAYRQYIDAMNKDTKAMLGAATASGGRVVMGGSSSSAGGPPKRTKILNNPLEKIDTSK